MRDLLRSELALALLLAGQPNIKWQSQKLVCRSGGGRCADSSHHLRRAVVKRCSLRPHACLPG